MNKRRRFKAKRKRRDLRMVRRMCADMGMTMADWRDLREWVESADGKLFLEIEV